MKKTAWMNESMFGLLQPDKVKVGHKEAVNLPFTELGNYLEMKSLQLVRMFKYMR